MPVNTCLPNHSQSPQAFLKAHFLSHFLNWFVCKNPKQIKTGGKGASTMQSSASAIDGCQVESKGEVGVELMVNEAAFF